jgi:uncharacterized damage-inducible protein DinB
MNRQLKSIIQNLEESFDGKPWYGVSVMEKLNSIPWQTVNEEFYGTKSIAVLVQHIINWRVFVLKKLQGDSDYEIEMDSANDWTAIQINSKNEWLLLKVKLQETQDNLTKILSQRTDAILEKQVPGKGYKFLPILNSISQHDIYHLGQIAMLNSAKKG